MGGLVGKELDSSPLPCEIFCCICHFKGAKAFILAGFKSAFLYKDALSPCLLSFLYRLTRCHPGVNRVTSQLSFMYPNASYQVTEE